VRVRVDVMGAPGAIVQGANGSNTNGLFQFASGCNFRVGYTCLMNTSGDDWADAWCSFSDPGGNYVWVRHLP